MAEIQYISKVVKIISSFGWGITPRNVSYGYKLLYTKMKEHLEANLLTKHLAGWCSEEEEAYLKKWLTQNPQHQMTLAVIKQQFTMATLQTGLKF